MKIGFDAKRYFHNFSGLGNYSRDLVNNLIALYPDNKYFLYDKEPASLDLPSNTIAVLPSNTGLFWRVFGIRKEIALYKPDIFHGLSNELPYGKWPAGVKKVVSIHDVIFKEYPQQYAFSDRWIYDKKTGHALKVADCVVLTSKATLNSLQKHYKVDTSKCKVVYQTCHSNHWKTYKETEVSKFRTDKKLPQKFILYVSSFQERKNHIRLLQALAESKLRDLNLVLAGKPGKTLNMCKEFVKEKNLEQQVYFIEDIQNSELPLLYRSAQGFIYPSMIEGFGIPLLEAMCAGLPIAVNDIEVFREIAPADAVCFNADDLNSVAAAMKNLVSAGPIDYQLHLEQFTPAHTAAQTMDIYKSLLS